MCHQWLLPALSAAMAAVASKRDRCDPWVVGRQMLCSCEQWSKLRFYPFISDFFIIRIYKPTSMIECQQVFFFRGWFVPTDLLPRFFGSVSYVLSLSGDGFCQRPRPPSPVLHLCIVPFGRPGSFSVLKTESRFGQKNRWLVNVSWAWKTRQDVETFRRKD